jgi:hypothetical protein
VVYFRRSLPLSGKAVAAVNRTVISRLKRYARLAAAGRARGGEHLSGGGAAVFPGLTAGFAALGFVGEAFFCVEVLFACAEDKLCAAVFTCENFVLGHEMEYLNYKKSAEPHVRL